jgi:hypothetical protein
MRWSIHRTAALALFVFAAGCVGSGDETVVILQDQAPQAGCVVAAGIGSTFIGSGLIDTASAQGYVFTPIAQNFATATAENEHQHIAFVTGADVDISFADDTLTSKYAKDGVTRFEVPYAAMIAPGGTASMAFEIVPHSLINQLGAELSAPSDRVLLLVDVQLVGTLNNGDFNSQTFRFPVEVCSGCLAQSVGACSSLSTSFMPVNEGGNCNPLQDAPVDCCSNDTGGFVCPAVGTGAALRGINELQPR